MALPRVEIFLEYIGLSENMFFFIFWVVLLNLLYAPFFFDDMPLTIKSLAGFFILSIFVQFVDMFFLFKDKQIAWADGIPLRSVNKIADFIYQPHEDRIDDMYTYGIWEWPPECP